ncbi:uncharacterized protein LOC132887733 isoform X4 [Neoarius graeffei]|uniref:uncharacterized protein LOC132887733 isoform X4 n=1 Tax=Neoarius graeffei TaxID=443677 RepID=UPI00298CDAD2|nr:uncharacterized protein LOC132887733 isoform X4 [Neoarius graeffei]
MSLSRSDVSQNNWFCSNTCFHSGHQQVSNPVIPYVGPIISGGLKPGMVLNVRGVVSDNANQFSINFQTGQNKYDDIAFHFNPWIGQYVYLNSFQKGNWKVKECIPDDCFTRGEAFNMFIDINRDGYEVYVNNLRHYMFKHRIPLKKVTTLRICGDVSIEFFDLCENWRSSCFTEQAITSSGISLLNMFPNPSEVSHQVIQPVLPHVGKIRDRLKPEMAIFFQGALPTHPKEFEINFQTGQSDGDDIAFHFNPRIGQFVYLNSFRNGSWEKEECVSDELFTKGAAFYMFVIISTEGYEVYVNGMQYCRFNHRIPLENISAISIYGDVTIPIYGFIDNWSKPFTVMDLLKITGMGSSFSSMLPILSEASRPVILPALPYVGTIKGGIRPDMAILFHGAVSEHGKSFEINLLTGDSDNDDIAFHISPQTGKSVALNSFINGSWETEEYASDNPFTKGASFDLVFVINSEGYEVYVNSLQHCTFKHRIPLEKVSTLGIRGDVTINYFDFVDNWSTSFMAMKINEVPDKLSVSGSPVHIPSEISHPVISPELSCAVGIPEDLKTGTDVTFQVTLPTDDKDAVDTKSIPLTEKQSKTTIVTESKDTQDVAITSGSLTDVLEEISHPVNSLDTYCAHFCSSQELPYVDAISECLKPDMDVTSQMTIPTDDKDAVNFKSIPQTESESSIVAESKDTQDEAITSWSLMDILPESSHPVSSPELPYVDEISECLKADMDIASQMTIPTDDKDAVNFESIPQTEYQSESSIVAESKDTQDEAITSWSLMDILPESSHPVSSPVSYNGKPIAYCAHFCSSQELPYVDEISECLKADMDVASQMTIPTDDKDAVNFESIPQTESESSIVAESKDTQDEAITSWSLMDVLPESSHPVSSPVSYNGKPIELPYVDEISECLKADMDVACQMTIPTDDKDAVNFESIPQTESESSIVAESKDTQDEAITSWSLMDVLPESSHPVSSPELPYVDEISECLKADMDVACQMTIPTDDKDAVNFESIPQTESESSIVAESKDTQDEAITSWSLMDVLPESSHPVSSPVSYNGKPIELPRVDAIPEGLQIDTDVTFQVTLPTDDKDAVNFKSIPLTENQSESSIVTESNDTQDVSLTSRSLTDVPSEISYPVSSPALPFVATIPGGVKADMAVLFYGTILADSNEFEINFQTSQSSDDIAFNINPQIVRFLVLSSLRNGSWETEDFASDKGAPFNMLIVIKLEGYEVYVNGLKYCMFKHHILSETISSLGIHGDVSINFIGFIDNWSSSSMVMENIKITGIERSCWRPILIPSEVSHPVLPYIAVIPRKIRPDMAVLFQGTLPADANEFAIHFRMGESDSDDIAFHINPHLGQYVALNSFRNGSWETEESASDKPFTKGAAFNMFVVIKSEGFEVYVNGLELCTFKHRMPLENISMLGICGDVSISFIGFIETWSKFSFIIENNEITSMRSSAHPGDVHLIR